MKSIFFLFFLFLTASCFPNSIEIILWHALDDTEAEIFQKIVNDFNYQSYTYRVIPQRKASYKELYKMGLDAYFNGRPPHILHICEAANRKARQTTTLFKPIDQLMKHFHKSVDEAAYFDVIRNAYSDKEGALLSLPWNVSMGILLYNKDSFAKANLQSSPKTWEELEAFLEILASKESGGFASAWPSSYHLQHVCCWHHCPIANAADTFPFLFNESSQLYHTNKLIQWHKKGFFHYANCGNEETEALFLQRKCAILLQGINRLPQLLQKADFPIGVGLMPYWAKFQKPLPDVGGGSFWVFTGFSEREYRGIVHFLYYLLSPEVQSYWHQKTGFLPITEAAYYLTKKKRFYEGYSAMEMPIFSLLQSPSLAYCPTHFTKNCQLIMGYLENAFSKSQN